MIYQSHFWVTILSRVGNIDFIKQVTFKQQLEAAEGISYKVVWAKCISLQEQLMLDAEMHLESMMNFQKTRVAGESELGGKSNRRWVQRNWQR